MILRSIDSLDYAIAKSIEFMYLNRLLSTTFMLCEKIFLRNISGMLPSTCLNLIKLEASNFGLVSFH